MNCVLNLKKVHLTCIVATNSRRQRYCHPQPPPPDECARPTNIDLGKYNQVKKK